MKSIPIIALILAEGVVEGKGKGSRPGKGSGKGSKTCFENKGFGEISQALASPTLDYAANMIIDYGRRNLATEHRELGSNTREGCMDVGGFPVYYAVAVDSTQIYLGCVPACEIDLKVLEDSCVAKHAGGACDEIEGYEGLTIGVGTNPAIAESFFAYCCQNEGLVDFVNTPGSD